MQSSNEGGDMQYAVLIHEKPGVYEALGDDERKAITAEYWALREEPGVLTGASLQPASTATTVRMDEGKALLTDGPFADTKEVFAGYYVLEADDLDAALAFAARVPAVRLGGAVEVRAVREGRRN
jgi:hypothetical protein